MGRKIFTSNKLDVRSNTINQIVRWYFANELQIDCSELIWSLDDQKLYIDSLLRKYPSPSIIVNSFEEKNADGIVQDKKEIIDGIQRIYAILSFIKNDFSIKFENYEGYFDMRVIPSMQQKSIIQKYPILPLYLCCNFADYELPVTLISQDDDTIKEIYIRLISNKPSHLSKYLYEN